MTLSALRTWHDEPMPDWPLVTATTAAKSLGLDRNVLISSMNNPQGTLRGVKAVRPEHVGTPDAPVIYLLHADDVARIAEALR